MLDAFLKKLGLGEKEQAIYMALASVGLQPASVLARRLGYDRVVTYKFLKRLASHGLVKIYLRDGVQYFGITGSEGIDSYLQEQTHSIEDLARQIPEVDMALRQVTRGEGFVPKVQVFEGKSGIKSLFRDLLSEARKEGILRIRMLTSNTFDQQIGTGRLSVYMDTFFRDAKKDKLAIEIIESSGTLLPEYIRRIDPRHFHTEDIPAARGATNVFLVGTALYLACYGDSLIGLKVKQEQMSQVFHFFFDAICKQVPPPDLRPPMKLETWLKRDTGKESTE
jgi:hypothetical protein